MTKELCPECGKLLEPNKYGVLYCSRCQPGFNKDFNEMVESTGGGYY